MNDAVIDMELKSKLKQLEFDKKGSPNAGNEISLTDVLDLSLQRRNAGNTISGDLVDTCGGPQL